MKPSDLPPGATPLDPDEMEGLKIKIIKTRGELNRWEQQNIAKAVAWLPTRNNKKDILNEGFVKKLHLNMLNDVWAWAGTFRKTNKNIGVDKLQIAIELRKLLDDTKFQIANKTFSEDEIAVRFHHRLVQIHCFPNGNGRHARLMTDTLLEDVLEKALFSWGSGDLANAGNVRDEYIMALQSADKGDFEPLKSFVRK